MVARTPPKQQRKLTVLAPLNPILIRETVKKVDQCMARLQELQYTVTGGNKVVAGVSLSPRSTRAYLKTSIRCKQESIRGTASRKSPLRLHSKVPLTGEWRRMSLPAMLVGETVGEILRASKFAKEITETVSQLNSAKPPVSVDPITPVATNRKQQTRTGPPTAAHSPALESRRKKEKQRNIGAIRSDSNVTATNTITATSPLSLRRRRARSRINFKVSSPPRPQRQAPISAANIMRDSQGNSSSMRYSANRISPKHRPWGKKAVLFPNPLFNELQHNSQRQRFCKTKSPMIGRKIEREEGNNRGSSAAVTTPTTKTTPHKFLIKSPPSSRSRSKFQVRVKSPLKVTISPPKAAIGSSKRSPAASPLKVAASKLRRSLSPARLVNRLASPLRSRRSSSIVQRTVVVNGMKGVVAPPSMVGLKSLRM